MSRIIFLLSCLFLTSTAYSNIPPVPEMYKLVANEQRVPAKLFYALVLAESRKPVKRDSGKVVLPWPWTINHRGQGYYFQSKREAFEFVSTLLKEKDHRFDIGLGQLNWHWNRKKFLNHWDALDPYTNLTVSARYLRQQYDSAPCNSWEKAIGCYHRSRQKPADRKIAQEYARRVIRLWNQI